jgi:uncharacterized protein YjlB
MKNESDVQRWVQQVDVVARILSDDGTYPNSDLALLVYPAAVRLPDPDPAAALEALFAAHRWGGSWRDGVYSYHHYHSTAHEVLGVYGGQARVQLGGEAGIVQLVRKGDVVVIPAGVAHKNLEHSVDFRVVGADPNGQRPDMCTGREGERPSADRRVAALALPEMDPVYGAQGPLIVRWSSI